MTGMLRLRPQYDRALPALQELFAEDPGYALRVTGEAPEPDAATNLFIDRPPDLPASQKIVLGAFDDDGPAAVIDFLRGWPDPTTAHIGLLQQVHPSCKRKGVGRRARDLLLAHVADWTEVTTLRAAIVGTNAVEAEPFWAALDYQPTGTPRPYQAGATATEVTAWTRSAHGSNPAANPAPNPAQPPRRTP